jgi:hypothetical protein
VIRRLFFMVPAAVLMAAALVAGSAASPAAARFVFDFDVEPAAAAALVGGDHTVTAIPTIEQAAGQTQQLQGELYVGIYFRFEVIAGPNFGSSSLDGGCEPSNCEGGINEIVHDVSWSYHDFGGAGTDVIEVCGLASAEVQPVVVLDGDFEGAVCHQVIMTWVPRPRGSLPAAILPALAQTAKENRERAAAAAQPAPTVSPPSTGTGILPPNTGDAGLKAAGSQAAATLYATAALGAALALGGMGILKRPRR